MAKCTFYFISEDKIRNVSVFLHNCYNLSFFSPGAPDLQPDLRDPPSADPAVATESLHRRGARQEAAGAHPPGPAERPTPPHRHGAALPRAGGHHRQGQAAGGAAGRGGDDPILTCFFFFLATYF